MKQIYLRETFRNWSATFQVIPSKLVFFAFLISLVQFQVSAQPANQPPVASNVVAANITEMGKHWVHGLIAYDADGPIGSYTIVTVPRAGRLYIGSSISIALVAGRVISAAEAEDLYYEPPLLNLLPISGNYTFTYTATDNSGVVSNTATYTIPVSSSSPTLPTPATIIARYVQNSAGQVTIPALKATGGTIDGYRITSLPSPLQGVLYFSSTAAGARTAITELTNGYKDLTTAEASNLWFDPVSGYSGTVVFTYSASNIQSTDYATDATYSIPVLPDNDGDGIPDVVDIDDDNDGITDIVESGGLDPSADDDGDGIPNYKDSSYPGYVDVNGDGINDRFDKEVDGIINAFDLDSDGDGIPDVVEANNGKTNIAGYDLNTSRLTDTIHSNGMPEVAQVNGNGISVFALGDKDKDGLMDFLDLDSDGDGVTDNTEGRNNGSLRIAKYTNAVGDYSRYASDCGCGMTGTPLTPPDTDGDGLPDYLDLDSDSDGIPDNVEAQGETPVKVTTPADADNDGLDDVYDPSCGCSTNGSSLTPIDTDNDGVSDYRDLDSDNDSMSDFMEAFDSNRDGQATNDILAMANNFRTRATGDAIDYYYAPTASGSIPAWLQVVPERDMPAFLVNGNLNYYDTDYDGLVDLFDVDNFGATPISYNSNFRTGSSVEPYPVRLLNFKANALQHNIVTLIWETTSEEGTDYFEIERSSDGRSFSPIKRIMSKGNSVVLQKYSYRDNVAENGTYYYRLRIVDADGTFNFSNMIASTTNSAQAENNISIFPNPTSSDLTVALYAVNAETVVVRVLDKQGQVKTQTKESLEPGKNNVRLSLQNLSTGMYMVQVTGRGINFTGRVLKR